MSRRKYPQIEPWERTSKERHFLIEACKKCGHQFSPTEKFWIREARVSYMRGDDEVEVLCDPCRKGESRA